MKAHYLAIYQILGASRLSSVGDGAVLLNSESPAYRAFVTADPEPHLVHIDRAGVLAHGLLSGLLGSGQEGTIEERIAAAAEERKGSRKDGHGAYLVFEGIEDIVAPQFELRRDTESFAVSLDDFDKEGLKARFEPMLQSVLTATMLVLPSNADLRLRNAGSLVFLSEDDTTSKPIYVFKLQAGSARVSVSSPLGASSINDAALFSSRIAADNALTRVVRLLVLSADKSADELEAFIAGWSALEIFINATFKSTYDARWRSTFQEAAPPAAQPVLRRLEEVMSDKYRVADKFLIIAALLRPEQASADAAEFAQFKKKRDELFHALDSGAKSLPTEKVQALLREYLKLHLIS